MAQVTNDKIEAVAQKLWAELYEKPFRGKERGRFALTRDQLRQALGVQKLHGSTTARLQEECLEKGLVLIDLDEIFPCIETKVVQKYRRPPKAIFSEIFGNREEMESDAETEEVDEGDEE